MPVDDVVVDVVVDVDSSVVENNEEDTTAVRLLVKKGEKP
jgi:hypothetical protein